MQPLLALVVLLLLVIAWMAFGPSLALAPASQPAPAQQAGTPAPQAGALPDFLSANAWEKRLPSGARTVFNFTFQGDKLLMRSAAFTGAGSAAGTPVGATTSWSLASPDSLLIAQGPSKLEVRRLGPKEIGMGAPGAPPASLTAAA
jgi:hypothetical protein